MVQNNLLYRNYIQRYLDERVDTTSHEVVWAKIALTNPHLGQAIIKSLMRSNDEKISEVVDRLATRSTLGIIFGKRRHGKTALFYWLAEQIHLKYPKKPLCIVGALPHINLLPKWFIPIVETSEAPSGAIVFFDEAALKLSSRRAMSKENVDETIEMAVSGHKDFSILYSTQTSALIDLNLIRMADVFFMKKLSMADMGADVQERRRMLRPSHDYFNLMCPRGKEVNFRETLYLDDDRNGFLFENDLPTFWSEEFSKPYRKMNVLEAVDFVQACWNRGASLKIIQKELQARDLNLAIGEIENMARNPKKVKEQIELSLKRKLAKKNH